MMDSGFSYGSDIARVMASGTACFFRIGVMDARPSSEWWFGTSPEGFGTIAMLVNFTISIVVSRMTPAPPEHVQEMVENIRIPSGAGDATVH